MLILGIVVRKARLWPHFPAISILFAGMADRPIPPHRGFGLAGPSVQA
jgi:hypothetical protein